LNYGSNEVANIENQNLFPHNTQAILSVNRMSLNITSIATLNFTKTISISNFFSQKDLYKTLKLAFYKIKMHLCEPFIKV